MEPLQLNWEIDRATRKAQRKRRREIRKTLVMGDPRSRPAFLWRTVAWVLGRIRRGVNHEDHAKVLVEQGFVGACGLAFLIAVGFIVADAAVAGGPRSAVAHHTFAGAFIFVAGLALAFLAMLDIGSYKPRIFAKCTGPAEDFFDDLAQLSPTLRDQVSIVTGAKPRTWGQAKELEQRLLAESHQFLLIDRLRFRVTARMMARLAALILGLAIAGYGLAAIANTPVLAQTGDVANQNTLIEYVYFATTTFFTIGFGDIRPAHHATGYGYLALIVLCFVLVFYFVLTEIIASHGEFKLNIRTAAESFVLERSRF